MVKLYVKELFIYFSQQSNVLISIAEPTCVFVCTYFCVYIFVLPFGDFVATSGSHGMHRLVLDGHSRWDSTSRDPGKFC